MVADRYDVIVVGGGVAGVAAAVASARVGASTLLIERYGFLGGLATAGLVNPFMSSFTSDGKPLVGGFYSEICERMAVSGAMHGRSFDPEAMKFYAQEMVLESGAKLLLHSIVSGVHTDGNHITGLDVIAKSSSYVFETDIIVDATGDADVAAAGGVPFQLGRSADGMTQAMTLMFIVGGVAVDKALVYAKDHPQQMRFPKPTDDEEIEALVHNGVGIAGFYEQVERARERGEFPIEQDMVFFLTLPTPGHVVVNTTHITGYNGTSAEDLTLAEIEGRRQVMALMAFLRNYIPGFEQAYLVQTATQIGVRESRRIVGKYVFDVKDILSAAKFHDAVLRSAYPVDIHSPIGKGYSRADDEKRPLAPPPGEWYEVPYRCLLPLRIDNLLVAGRCISATHEGQAAVRIMPNCMALGQAAGTAAALCAKEGILPGNLNTSLLREVLVSQGAIV